MTERIDIYLNYNGNAAEAARFYSDAFGKNAQIMKFSEFPDADQMQGINLEKVGHAEIAFDNMNFMFSDGPGMELTPGNNYSLSFWTDDEETYHKIWRAFVEGGSTVHEEPAQSFFAKLYGRLVDPFGVSWLILFDDTSNEKR